MAYPYEMEAALEEISWRLHMNFPGVLTHVQIARTSPSHQLVGPWFHFPAMTVVEPTKTTSNLSKRFEERLAQFKESKGETFKSDEDCKICWEEKAWIKPVPCLHHVFCESCLREFLKIVKDYLCPICRVPIDDFVMCEQQQKKKPPPKKTIQKKTPKKNKSFVVDLTK